MIFAFFVAFVSLISLMILHEFGHFILAKKFGVKVEEFGIGYPPRIFGKKIGETIYSINLLPFGAFVKIYGEEGGIEDYRSFIGKPVWQRALIVLGGILSFWVVAVILFVVVFGIGAEAPVSDEANQKLINPRVQIWQVASNSPAEMAGIKVGDIIKQLKTDNQQLTISKAKEVQEFVETNKGKEITLTVQRNKETFEVSLVPRVSPPKGEGAMGVALERIAIIIPKHSWYRAPIQGILYSGELTVRAVQGLSELVIEIFRKREVPPGVEPAGAVGIFVYLARAAEFGFGFFLYFVGIITILVAIFNFLPIPALDGGKLLFLVTEKIMRKPIPQKIEQSITKTFLILLIILVFFITIKFDIPRLTEFIKARF